MSEKHLAVVTHTPPSPPAAVGISNTWMRLPGVAIVHVCGHDPAHACSVSGSKHMRPPSPSVALVALLPVAQILPAIAAMAPV